jgi:uncharacterized membrane protein
MDSALLIILGMLFIALGIILSAGAGARVQGGAVIFVGPIPVVFATDRDSAILVLLMALVTLLAVILWLRT